MSHVLHREGTTRWSPEAVFEYLVDFSHAEEWDSGTVPLLTPFLRRLGDDTAAQLKRVLDEKAGM